jgi:hypothetical protein
MADCKRYFRPAAGNFAFERRAKIARPGQGG